MGTTFSLSANTLAVIIGLIGVFILVWPADSARARIRAIAVRPRRGSTEGRGVFGSTRLGRILRERQAHDVARKWLPVAAPGVALFWFAGVPGAIAGALLGRSAQKVLESGAVRRAASRDEEDLSRSLETLIAQLRAGADAAAALTGAARELGGRGGENAKSGVSRVAEALRSAARRAHFADPWEAAEGAGEGGVGKRGKVLPGSEASSAAVAPVARVWGVAQRHGLSLAGLLECVRGDVEARRAHRSQTAAALAGPRMTIAILAGLPVFGLVMGQAFGARPFEFFTGSVLGGGVLVAGVGLVCAGIEWSVAIIDRAESGS